MDHNYIVLLQSHISLDDFNNIAWTDRCYHISPPWFRY